MDARKTKIGADAALALLEGLHTLVAGRGKTHVAIDLRKRRPPPEELLKQLLGPSGNLRAPAIRRGKLLLVGFCEEAYANYLGPAPRSSAPSVR